MYNLRGVVFLFLMGLARPYVTLGTLCVCVPVPGPVPYSMVEAWCQFRFARSLVIYRTECNGETAGVAERVFRWRLPWVAP